MLPLSGRAFRLIGLLLLALADGTCQRALQHIATRTKVLRLPDPLAPRTAHSSFSAVFTSLPLKVAVGQPFVLLALNIPTYPM